MKIALWIRRDAKGTPGGDYTQLLNTKLELEKLGIETVVCFGIPPKVKVDLVHAFNLTRLSDTYNAFKWAKNNEIPFAISSIWHSVEKMENFYRKKFHWPSKFPIFTYLGLKELIYSSGLPYLSRLRLIYSFKKIVKKIITEADAVLPNSPEEAEVLQKEVKAKEIAEINVIPNGIRAQEPEENLEKRNIVVCAGRIEPRKNQIRIIEAFRSSVLYGEWKLVFIGAENRNDRLFTKKFRRNLEEGSIEWRGALSHGDALSLYGSAKAIVLASHFETTGLVALEGLRNGCRVIMTNNGYNDFYFGDSVMYCDPDDVHSITRQLNQLAQSDSAKCSIDFEYFAWPNAAALTAEAYLKILRA